LTARGALPTPVTSPWRPGASSPVGRVNGEAARRRINVQGLTLAPGFIDPHTHYDAQVSWDRLLRHTGALPGRVLRAA
jgi:N-acyl-D-aspartate/D-glutamate deacylase